MQITSVTIVETISFERGMQFLVSSARQALPSAICTRLACHCRERRAGGREG